MQAAKRPSSSAPHQVGPPVDEAHGAHHVHEHHYHTARRRVQHAQADLLSRPHVTQRWQSALRVCVWDVRGAECEGYH